MKRPLSHERNNVQLLNLNEKCFKTTRSHTGNGRSCELPTKVEQIPVTASGFPV